MADTEKNQDEEFAGFENLDDTFEDPAALLDDDTLDADFQDVDDAALEDVFEEEQAPTAKPKKKVNWFNIIIALVAVLGAGGLIMVKLAPQILGHGDSMQQMPPAEMAAVDTNTNPANAQAAAQAALMPVPGDNKPVNGDMLNNPDGYAQLAQNSTPAPASVPAKGSDPFAAVDNAAANPAPAANTGGVTMPDLPMPAPITSEPAPAASVAPVAQMPASAVVPAAPVAVETAPIALATDTAAVSALKGQVDNLSGRMDTIETKLDAALSAASKAQTASAPAGDDPRFEAIQSTLARLESRLDDMATSTKTRVAQAVRDVTNDDETPAPVVHKTTRKSASRAKKSTSAWDGAYKSTASATPVSAGSGNDGWTLRGAQPGQALLGGKDGDIRQVGVGDTVPGLGQITGIASLNGRWVVQGTQGRVAQ